MTLKSLSPRRAMQIPGRGDGPNVPPDTPAAADAPAEGQNWDQAWWSDGYWRDHDWTPAQPADGNRTDPTRTDLAEHDQWERYSEAERAEASPSPDSRGGELDRAWNRVSPPPDSSDSIWGGWAGLPPLGVAAAAAPHPEAVAADAVVDITTRPAQQTEVAAAKMADLPLP